MQNLRGLGRIALVGGIATTLLLTVGCGISGNSKQISPAANTYLYVPEGDSWQGTVAQFHVESDGTLTPLSPATVAGPSSYGTNFVTVDPSGTYLFANSALLGGTAPVNQYVIGSDGTLAPNAIPTINVTGWNELLFTPNGQFAFVPDFQDGVVDTYSLSSSGTLSQSSQLSVGAIPANVQPMATDASGRFLYVFETSQIGFSNSFSYSLMEYSISATGGLTPLAPIYAAAPGYTYSLKVAPNGFLYFPNVNDGIVTAFQIDESTGQLANAGGFATGTGPGSTPLSIAFDPTGAYAYVVNYTDNSVTQFTANASTGALTMNGPDTPTGQWPTSIAVDPSGKFAFVANADGTISQFTINSNGRLMPNGAYSLGAQTFPGIMGFSQR